MPTAPRLTVREMLPNETHLRSEYFHGASDAALEQMGVDRARLPSPEAWRDAYTRDVSRPIDQRQLLLLHWERDGEPVGFSSCDRIEFGVEAHMHLHVLQSDDRRRGLGTAFVRLSADYYFRVLELERLYCEPNAYNVAPNRAVQKAGFRYLFTAEATPGPINVPQITTRWVLEREVPHTKV